MQGRWKGALRTAADPRGANQPVRDRTVLSYAADRLGPRSSVPLVYVTASSSASLIRVADAAVRCQWVDPRERDLESKSVIDRIAMMIRSKLPANVL